MSKDMEASPQRTPVRHSYGAVHYTKTGDSFVANVPDSLICVICASILDNPHQCRGGHLYCYDCIRNWLKKSQHCPVCSCPLTKDSIGRNVVVASLISELEIQCNNSAENSIEGTRSFAVAQSGCQWVGPMAAFDHHCRKDCAHILVACNNADKGCITEVLWSDLQRHLQICSFEEVSCNLCFEHMLRGNLASHKGNDCPNLKLGCPNGCGQIFLRRNQANHSKLCQEEKIGCPYSQFGCDATDLRRKDYAAHQAESVQMHVDLVQQKVSTLETEKNELQSDVRAMKFTVSDLRAQISSIKSTNSIPLMWRTKIPAAQDDVYESGICLLQVPSYCDSFCVNAWLSLCYIKEHLYLYLNISPVEDRRAHPLGIGGTTISCGGRVVCSIPQDALVPASGDLRGMYRVRLSQADIKAGSVNGEISITALLCLKDAHVFEL